MTGGVSLLSLQKWPKDNGRDAIQSHEIHECRIRDDSSGGWAKEDSEVRWPSFKQKKEGSLDEWAKGRQEIKTPVGEDNKLHLFEYPLDQVLVQIRDGVALTCQTSWRAIQAKGLWISIIASTWTMGMTPLSAMTSSSRSKISSSRGSYSGSSGVVKTHQGTLSPTNELKKGPEPCSKK